MAARQRKGDGSIKPRKLKDGTTVYDLRIRVNGVPYNRGGFPTEQAAIRERDRVRANANPSALQRQRKLRVPEVVEQWLERTGGRVGSTMNVYNSALEHHIRPHLNVRVENLTKDAMDQFIRELPGRLPKHAGTGRSIADRVVQMVKASHRWAATPSVRLIAENPLRDTTIELPPKGPRRRAVRTQSFAKLIEASEGYMSRDLWLLLGTTGARKGEILPLQRGDFTFHVETDDDGEELVTAVVRIDKISTPESSGREVESRVKMNQEREIPLGPDVAGYFYRKFRDSPKKDTALLFPSPTGVGPVRHASVADWWARDCDAAGIDRLGGALTIHSLRHMFTTFMIDAKEDVNVVSKILGHASTQITLGIYKDVTDDQKSRAVRAMSTVTKGLKL